MGWLSRGKRDETPSSPQADAALGAGRAVATGCTSVVSQAGDEAPRAADGDVVAAPEVGADRYWTASVR